MRIVFDTDVLFAALVTHGLCRKLVRKRLAADIIISSAALLDELAQTVQRKIGADPATVPLFRVLRERGEIVTPAALPRRICRDADDDMVLATAVAGEAEIIITGDKDLLILKKYRGIRILSPRQYMEFLDRPR